MNYMTVFGNTQTMSSLEVSALTGKSVLDFPRYTVSKDGDVFSLFFTSRTGRVIQRKEPKILSKAIDSDGYHVVTLYSDDEKITKKVHRLVASAYLDPDVDRSQVNHKNGNKVDNRVENLEWATNSENQKHRFLVLKHEPLKAWLGKENPNLMKPVVVLTTECKLIKAWPSQKSLAESGFCCKSSISNRIDTGIPVNGALLFSEKTVKAYHADVWREAFAVDLEAIGEAA